MYHEIERKFLVRQMPNLRKIVPSIQERYFLQRGDIIEERIQKNNSVYEYEKKVALSPRERHREKKIISENDFITLQKRAIGPLIRKSYSLSKKNPRISIKMYQGEYKSFVFAEVEFDSIDEYEMFTPLEWMGTEITNSPLGRDVWLLDYTREQFLSIFQDEKEKLMLEPDGS